MSKEKRLGRGLESLLTRTASISGDYSLSPDSGIGIPVNGERLSLYRGEPEEAGETRTDEILGELMREKPIYEIPIDRIDRNPHQPRIDFEDSELAELADSIKKHGMIQPIVVRQNDRRFELIAGERRMRAAKMAGWETVPAHILVVDDREMAELALTENLQRRDLNAIEKAIAFRNYLDIYGGTPDELAQRLDLDRSTIANMIRLLGLPDELQKMVVKGELPMGHARALLAFKDDREKQFETADKIVKEGWSVRQTEDYVRDVLKDSAEVETEGKRVGPRRATVERSEHFIEMENQFRSLFGTKVKLSSNAKGKGKLVIPFSSNDEFERIYQLILARMR